MKISTVRPWAAMCFAVLLATGSVFAEDALTITSPLELQVTQRTKEDRADIAIAGVVQGLADVIEAKVDLGQGATRGKAVDWTVIAQGPAIAEGKFSGKLSPEAGGWYVLSIRALRGKDVIATTKVMKVGSVRCSSPPDSPTLQTMESHDRRQRTIALYTSTIWM